MYNPGRRMESAEEVTPTVMKWLQDNAKEDNWFLHINYGMPIHPIGHQKTSKPLADEPYRSG